MKLPKVTKNQGYYLRVFRATYNMSQSEAATFLGISPSQWSLMEDGHRSASPKRAAKLAAATGAPVEIFLGIKVTR